MLLLLLDFMVIARLGKKRGKVSVTLLELFQVLEKLLSHWQLCETPWWTQEGDNIKSHIPVNFPK